MTKRKYLAIISIILIGGLFLLIVPRGEIPAIQEMIAKHQYQKVYEKLANRLSDDPTNPELNWLLAEALLGDGHPDLAAEVILQQPTNSITQERKALLRDCLAALEESGLWGDLIPLMEMAKELGENISEDDITRAILLDYASSFPDWPPLEDSLKADPRYPLVQWMSEAHTLLPERLVYGSDLIYGTWADGQITRLAALKNNYDLVSNSESHKWLDDATRKRLEAYLEMYRGMQLLLDWRETGIYPADLPASVLLSAVTAQTFHLFPWGEIINYYPWNSDLLFFHALATSPSPEEFFQKLGIMYPSQWSAVEKNSFTLPSAIVQMFWNSDGTWLAVYTINHGIYLVNREIPDPIKVDNTFLDLSSSMFTGRSPVALGWAPSGNSLIYRVTEDSQIQWRLLTKPGAEPIKINKPKMDILSPQEWVDLIWYDDKHLLMEWRLYPGSDNPQYFLLDKEGHLIRDSFYWEKELAKRRILTSLSHDKQFMPDELKYHTRLVTSSPIPIFGVPNYGVYDQIFYLGYDENSRQYSLIEFPFKKPQLAQGNVLGPNFAWTEQMSNVVQIGTLEPVDR